MLLASIPKLKPRISWKKKELIKIIEKYQNQIFKLFGRLHTQQDFPGTGLGLALSAKIVIYMNCEISIQSKTGKGTTLSIVLPKQELDTAIQC